MCADASFVLARLLPDERDDTVLDLWNDLLRNESVVAPPLMWAEITSALRRATRMGRLPADDAARAILDLIRLPIVMVTNFRVYPRALELARQLDLASAYDMQYLAVAELEGATLATLDRPLAEGGRRLGVPVLLVA